MRHVLVLFAALALMLSGSAVQGAVQVTDEEFVGPFGSWVNAKTDYGAIGDGKADDSAALQKALNDLRPADSKKRVLYVPAGTYRITTTLNVVREAHAESQGISIVGEDPATTIIRWDGPANGVMLYYSPWYARLGRLTLDGGGKALTAVRHGKPFATALEYADMVFKDVGFGIEAGEQNGIAETSVLRCKFVRCSRAGLSIQNWNSLDWWIWYCLFEDCVLGVTNVYGAGNFHVYESVFRNSTKADIEIGNLMYFSIRNNTSIGSQRFLFAHNFTAGALLTIQGNTVIEPKEATPIYLGNLGPALLLDNVIKCRPEQKQGPLVHNAGWADGDFVSVGNTYTVADPVKVRGRLLTLDDRVVAPQAVQTAAPELPGTPPNRQRKVIEVPAGADAAGIQAAVDQAAKLKGQRPVVHLPAGSYAIDRTLVIPAGCDVQLVGDGILNATQLNWTGGEGGPVLRLAGPSRATLREFGVNGAQRADGIVVEDCDQAGGRVFTQGTQVGSGKQAGLLVDGLEKADVSLHDFGHGDCKVGVRVVGGPQAAAGKQVSGRVVIFSGASSNNEVSYQVEQGGRLLVRDIWYESGSWPGFIQFSGAGTFTLHGAQMAVKAAEETPAVELSDFHGKVTLLNVFLTTVDPKLPARIRLTGDGRGLKLLALGIQGNKPQQYLLNEARGAQVALLNSRWAEDSGETTAVPDEGAADPAFLREMLAETRSARPRLLTPVKDGLTDVRLYRVFVSNTQVGIHLRASRAGG